MSDNATNETPDNLRGRRHLRAILGFGRLRADEYRASINALNIFFGAIIGVNFASLEALPPLDYAAVLLVTSAVVALILIVSNTTRRVSSVIQLLLALGAYYWLFRIEQAITGVSDNLLITLGIWAGSALFYEFSGRLPEEDAAGDAADNAAGGTP